MRATPCTSVCATGGCEVFAVNPNAEEVEGDRCYHDLRLIPDGVDAVVIGTRSEIADPTMRECETRSSTGGCTAAPAREASRRRRPSTGARGESPSSTAAARACSVPPLTSAQGDADRLHAQRQRPEGGSNGRSPGLGTGSGAAHRPRARASRRPPSRSRKDCRPCPRRGAGGRSSRRDRGRRPCPATGT